MRDESNRGQQKSSRSVYNIHTYTHILQNKGKSCNRGIQLASRKNSKKKMESAKGIKQRAS